MKQRWGDSAYLLDSLGENPLPNSVVVTVGTIKAANKVTSYAAKLDGVEDVTYYKETVEKLMKDNAGKTKTYNSDGDCTKLKYVVLVNQYTASTSEILAAAIKDNHGGKLMGMTTFGKGIVQQTTTLNDGSVLKLTVMQYFSPDGHVIHKKGITPDYKVDLTSKDTTDKQLEKAMKLFK